MRENRRSGIKMIGSDSIEPQVIYQEIAVIRRNDRAVGVSGLLAHGVYAMAGEEKIGNRVAEAAIRQHLKRREAAAGVIGQKYGLPCVINRYVLAGPAPPEETRFSQRSTYLDPIQPKEENSAGSGTVVFIHLVGGIEQVAIRGDGHISWTSGFLTSPRGESAPENLSSQLICIYASAGALAASFGPSEHQMGRFQRRKRKNARQREMRPG